MLQAGGFGIGIQEALEAHVLVQVVPMDADGADLVLGSLLVGGVPEV